ncbi:MAG TPA: dihydroorotate dehydrogenase [Acidimicrobiales bacterium]|nr:dihydroorotate dehydrogenase [Acidimicrobiales bacterium]
MSRHRSSRPPSPATAVDLGTTVGSVVLPNPVMTAAGTAGHGAELGAYFELSELGAVVVKSLAPFSWGGNPAPRLCPVPGGMLNAVGLQGPGLEAWIAHDLPPLLDAGARVVASIWGRTVDDFAAAGECLGRLRSEAAAPQGPGIVAVEVNVSCPNLEDRSRMFAHSPAATAAAVAAARRSGYPLWAKLSPNTSELVEVAGAALEEGAEALTLVNTLLGLEIDTAARRPVLAVGGGGLSGSALHPVALRAVFDCRTAYPHAGIVGVGGVSDGEGALRLLLAGADAVQVGTATLADPRAPVRVLRELKVSLERGHFGSVGEARSAAHPRDGAPTETGMATTRRRGHDGHGHD